MLSGPVTFLVAQDAQPTRPVAIGPEAQQPLRWKAKPIGTVSGIERNATTAGGATPVNEAPASGMKPIKLVSGYSSTTSPVGSGVVQASGVSETPAPSNAKTAAAGGWNKQRIDTLVTPAQATAPADPFSDPFNDRHATRPATLMLQPPGGAGAQPNSAAPGLNPSNPNFNPQTPNNPAPPLPPAFQQPNFQQPPTLPDNTQPMLPRGFDPTRPPPSLTPPPDNNPPPMPPMPMQPMDDPGGTEMPPRTLPDNNSPSNRGNCNRVYNDRNCCDSSDQCRDFFQRLMRDRLNKISLNIAPRFNADDAENEKKRADQERLAGSRKWYRRGVTPEGQASATPLAEGRLHNLQDGKAVILEESGQTREISLNDLSEDDLCFISGWWDLPAECAIASTKRVDLVSRGWTPSTLNWTASALCHKPLYFEQVQHERYGHTAGPFRQPWIDGVHFFGSAILLPYNMALDPPWECEYVLGYYRPGNCAPWQIPPFPFSPRAAMAQAGFVVGGIYIMP